MTQAMREREAARLGLRKKEHNEVGTLVRARSYPMLTPAMQSRIRIRFSDRTQLEATVPAAAQVPVLYHLLRSHLATEHAQTSFTLYQTPPKRDFPERTKDPKLRGKTLKELGMVPQAALNIRWEKAEMNCERLGTVHEARACLLALANRRTAPLIANTFPAPLDAQHKAKAEELPPPPTFDGVAPSANDQNTVTAASSGKAEGEPKKVRPDL